MVCLSTWLRDSHLLFVHCLSVNFVIRNSISETKDEEVDSEKSYVQTKYVWDKSLLDAYKLAISSSNIIESFDSLFENSQDVNSMDGIDNCVESFVGILDSVCVNPFLKRNCQLSIVIFLIKMIQMSYTMRNVKLKNMIFSTALTATEIVGMMKIGLKW